MCPDWWLNTALVGSAVRTLTEGPGNQGVANRAETVRRADPTGFHQSGHVSQQAFLSDNRQLTTDNSELPEPGGTGSKLSYRSPRAQRSWERVRTGSSHTCLRLIAAGRKLGLFCLPDSALIRPKLRSAND